MIPNLWFVFSSWIGIIGGWFFGRVGAFIFVEDDRFGGGIEECDCEGCVGWGRHGDIAIEYGTLLGIL